MTGVFFNGALHPLRPDGQYRACGLLGYFENKRKSSSPFEGLPTRSRRFTERIRGGYSKSLKILHFGNAFFKSAAPASVIWVPPK